MITWYVSFVDKERQMHNKMIEAITKAEAIRVAKLQNGNDIIIVDTHSMSE